MVKLILTWETTINDLEGGPEKIEKKEHEGPSPGNKISKAILRQKTLLQGKKFISDVCSAPPPVING